MPTNPLSAAFEYVFYRFRLTCKQKMKWSINSKTVSGLLVYNPLSCRVFFWIVWPPCRDSLFQAPVDVLESTQFEDPHDLEIAAFGATDLRKVRRRLRITSECLSAVFSAALPFSLEQGRGGVFLVQTSSLLFPPHTCLF